MGDRQKWDSIYRKSAVSMPAACSVLTGHAYLLPTQGQALDVACGLGGNALFMAKRGLQPTAIDISSVAIDKLRQHASSSGLPINTVAQDLTAASIGVSSYDVITVANYLDRELIPALIAALKPDGLLFYQTFVRDKADLDAGPSNPQYLLAANELLSLVKPLTVRAFSDLGAVGDVTAGLRNQSSIVAQRVA